MQNDLLQVLTDMRSGAVAIDISNKFDEMIRAVLDTGGNYSKFCDLCSRGYWSRCF